MRARRFLVAGLVGVLGSVFVVAGEQPNGSTDGRFHSCGFVTEQGVTDHLDAYAQRCGVDR